MKLWGREPALVIQGVSTGLALAVAFGLPGLSSASAGAIVALLAATLGAVQAWAVRPVAPAAFTAVVTTGSAMLTTFGLDLTQQQIGAVQAAVIAGLALILRGNVSPVE